MSADQQHMQCMEVWGGNSAMDSAVAMTGLDAWVYADPYESGSGGGDVYYVSSCATGRITRVLLADVSGHGTAVADTGLLLRGLMRRYVNHVDQARFIGQLNHAFAEHARPGGFATAVAIGYFAPRRTLALCNAGHPPPLVYRAREKRWMAIDDAAIPSPRRAARADRDADANTNASIANIPLGIDAQTSFTTATIKLALGDCVFCYSDSAIEAHGSDGRMLGVAGLLDLVNTLDMADTSTLLARLRVKLVELNSDNLTEDDVTMMLLTPNNGPIVASFGDRQRGTMAFFASILKRPFGGEPIPWPELTWQNFGGGALAMFMPQRKK